MSGSRVNILVFQFVPVVNVGVMDAHLGAHFGKSSHNQLAAAVACIAYVLSVAGATNQHILAGNVTRHITQSIADQLSNVDGAGIVNIYCCGCYLKNIIAVLKTKNVSVSPVP